MRTKYTNGEAWIPISELRPFHNGRESLWAKRFGENIYEIYSYATLMARVEGQVITYHDERQWSRTTTRHQWIIARGLSGIPYAPDATHLERKRRR